MNEIFDNRDFYQPLVTPYDIEVALNPSIEEINFSYDFNSVIPLDSELNESDILENSKKNDISLITGRLRNFNQDKLTDGSSNSNSLAVRPDGTVATNSNYGAGFLNERTWKGLEQNLGQTNVVTATEGRKGIAQSYDNEK